MAKEKFKYPFDFILEKDLKNKKIIEVEHSEEIELAKNMFNSQYQLLLEYSCVLNSHIMISQKNVETDLLMTALLKNMDVFYTSIDLNIRGLYGGARTLLRYIFEYQLIAKYCAISRDAQLLSRWENGSNISMQRDVFNKIDYPNVYEFKELWRLLCKFTHATIYSQQKYLDYKDNKLEVSSNFTFLKILLELNYHLLNSYFITSSMKFYVNHYGNPEISKELRRIMKDLIKHSKKDMEEASKKLIYNYKLKWRIKRLEPKM